MRKKFTLVAITTMIANILFLTGCNNDLDDPDSSIGESSYIESESTTSQEETVVDDETQELEEIDDDPIEEEVIADVEYIPETVDSENFQFVGIDALENEGKGWGQGVQVDEYNRPIACDTYQDKYMQYEAYFIMPNVAGEQKMYLTFDQGYENGYTSMILDSLLEKDCPAVFFLTLPYAKGNPELVQRMIDEGHVLGNHSVSHLSTPTLSPQKQAEEILELHNYIIDEYGYEMDLFRPPMGEWSTQSLEITRQLGYKTIFWSYAYRDWEVDNQMGVDVALPLVTGAAHNGGLYLLHSVSSDNAHMLGDVIDNIRAQGFEFCELDFDKITFSQVDDVTEVVLEGS